MLPALAHLLRALPDSRITLVVLWTQLECVLLFSQCRAVPAGRAVVQHLLAHDL